MKDHEIRELVNQLRGVAIKYHGTGQLREQIARTVRVAILQAQSDDDGEPTDDERIMAIEGIHNCERCGDEGWVVGEMGITRCACSQAGNSPVIPDGYVMVPKEPTEAMLTASYMFAHVDATRESWSAMLAAAPQSPGSEPATVPGKWIPVSERIPDNTEPVLCIEKRADFGTYGQPFVCWHDGGGWVGKTNYRPIVTHWMPLPAAPQEVKSE
ncbi:DUF551 domain-containing protein [Klebsiella pneumoniae]|uniref:DUF551 domain-containing protein n=1 Tax=Klebsiella pneumoniae TaxID=573 RepID=UPI0022479049|nr:DUF551 domain-containing protein [Klebsiella pneumoniae]MCW9169195.1 DUF551 domain-containing protein [Klebsiella pneumoniae]